MEYYLGDQKITYHAEGSKFTGDETVLLHQAIDITAGKKWGVAGFTIESLFPLTQFQKFKTGINDLLHQLWKKAGLKIDSHFHPDQYHTIASTRELHLAAVEKTKLISTDQFPLPIKILEERISEICCMPLHVLNPYDHQSIFHFRVIRPQTNDNNPLHRDVWLEDYANCVNLYIPIAGSNEKSSLAIIPGSHHWAESMVERTEKGATLSGVKFNVPAVTAIHVPYEIARPNPQENEVLLFSPYLIHGGAVNLNKNRTRISIEMRLWKKH